MYSKQNRHSIVRCFRRATGHTVPFEQPANEVIRKKIEDYFSLKFYYSDLTYCVSSQINNQSVRTTSCVDRNILNGREIVTVEEDGVLVSKTVDGEPRELF
jgi:hypothetical protein